MNDQQEAILKRLDFDAKVRCEERHAPGIECRDEARFATRCRACDQMVTLCALHLQATVVLIGCGAATAWCRGCHRVASSVSALFDVEALG